MASNIDVTVPRSGNADTARVRANFATIKTEVQDLHARIADLAARLDAGTELPEDAVRLAQLAQVALSGSYHHLAHRPHIPVSAEDVGALPLAGGEMTGPLSLFRNAGTAMEPVPLQQLQAMLAALAQVARSGRYADLLDTPALGTAASRDAGAFATAAQGVRADTAVQPQDLAPVATSGTFADMAGAVTEAQLAPAVAAKLNNTLPYNVSATRPPAAADDVNAGWLVGSLWVDVAGDEAYRCVDAAAGAAKWVKTTVDATELAALAFSGQYADLGGKPTTLAGYGITDAAPAGHVGAAGSAHAAATTSTAGFLSAGDKAKLDGIAAGAQVNAVASVNAKTGAVLLAHTDVGAAPAVHAHGEATSGAAGFLSAADKAKLDGIAAGANAYVHPASHPAAMVTEDATRRFVTDTEKSTWNGKAGTAVATTAANGLMSATDKVKLDGIAVGANAYVHPASGVTAGTYRSVTVDANGHVTGGTSPTTLAGYGITDAAASSHVGAGGTAHATATTATAGFLSAADKAKLDGVEAGANAYAHPASHPAAMVTEDATRRFVTDTEKSTWNGKAGTAVVTTAANGLMSATDKVKLDGINPSAYAALSGATFTGAVTVNAAVTASAFTGSVAANAASGFAGRNSDGGAAAAYRVTLGNNADSSDAYIQINSSTNTSHGGARSLNFLSNAGDIAFFSGRLSPVERLRINASTGAVTIGGNAVWHAGNLGAATTSAAGLMSAADKARLDTMGSVTSGVLPPVNQAPSAGALGISRVPTLQGSAFATVGSADTHAASQWQIATDAAFTTIIYDSGEVTT